MGIEDEGEFNFCRVSTVAKVITKTKISATSAPPACMKRCVDETGDQGAQKVNVEGHSIEEDPTWARAADIGAITVTCITCFLFGFFA